MHGVTGSSEVQKSDRLHKFQTWHVLFLTDVLTAKNFLQECVFPSLMFDSKKFSRIEQCKSNQSFHCLQVRSAPWLHF